MATAYEIARGILTGDTIAELERAGVTFIRKSTPPTMNRYPKGKRKLPYAIVRVSSLNQKFHVVDEDGGYFEIELDSNKEFQFTRWIERDDCIKIG